MKDSLYLSNDDPMTSPASNFLEIKPKIITKNEDQFMVLIRVTQI